MLVLGSLDFIFVGLIDLAISGVGVSLKLKAYFVEQAVYRKEMKHRQ